MVQETKIIQYFTCEKFTQMAPQARFQELQREKLCFQCLYPGANSTSGKHQEGHCQRDFTCQHGSHNKYPKKKTCISLPRTVVPTRIRNSLRYINQNAF